MFTSALPDGPLGPGPFWSYWSVLFGFRSLFIYSKEARNQPTDPAVERGEHDERQAEQLRYSDGVCVRERERERERRERERERKRDGETEARRERERECVCVCVCVCVCLCVRE
jgi:hypothetical protein